MNFQLQTSRKALIFVAVIIVACCFISCKKKEEASAPSSPSAEQSTTAAGEGSGAHKGDSVPQEKKRKVILNHSIHLEVKDLSVSLETLTKLAESSGGYVFKRNRVSREEHNRWGEVGLRIPVSQAGSVFTRIKELGRVENESSTAEDITEGYVDLEARLKNAQSSEARLTELYRKAGELSDVLEIEKELTRVRGDIEAFEAKRKNWDLLTEMVTIEVRLDESSSGFPSLGRIWSPIKTAFGKSLLVLADSLHSLIIFIGAVLPWLAVLGPITYLYVRQRRKTQQKISLPTVREKMSEEDVTDYLP